MIHPKFKTQIRGGFTLVELLVVISIIGILAGIAFPAYQKVQENGKSVKELSNLRQMGIAIHTDAADEDGYLGMLAGDGGEEGGGWAQIMRDRHIRENDIFKSPFDRNGTINEDPTGDSDLSYGVNSEVGNTGRLLDEAAYPSSFVVIAPITNEDGQFADQTINASEGATFDTSSIKSGSYAGGRRINALFLDGHAESMNFEEFKDSSSEAGKRRWNFLDDTE